MIPAPFTLAGRVEIVCAYLVGLCVLYAVCAGLCSVLERWIRRFHAWQGDREW